MSSDMDHGDTRGDALPLRVADAVTQGLNVIGSGLIVMLMLLVCADVLGRNFFGRPIAGVPELVTLSIVAIVFLQIPQALRTERITRSEAMPALLARTAPRIARALDTVFDILAIIVVSAIVWTTWPIFVRSWVRNDFIGAIGDFTAPTWPVKLTILIGGSMLVLQFAIRIFRRYARQR